MGIVYPAPAHLSHSQVSALLPTRANSCALRWCFARRLGMKETASLAMELGSALDDGLNALLRRPLFGNAMDLNEGLDAMRARVELIPEDVADAASRQAEARALEKAILMFWERHQDWHGQDVQFRFEVNLPGVESKVVGVIDRVDSDGTIVDHKLSRSQHAKEGVLAEDWVSERRHQLALYLAAVAVADGQEIGSRTKAALEVCYVTARLKTPQWTYVALEILAEEQVRAVQDCRTAEVVRDSGVYPAHPGQWCGFCSFTKECQAVQSILAANVVAIAEAVL